MMQKSISICPRCGGKKTPQSEICRGCRNEDLREVYTPFFGPRNKEIVEAVTKKGERAINVAVRFGLTRERVRQILVKNGVNYRELLAEWGRKREAEKKKKRQKLCRYCGKLFEMNANGATSFFCSIACRDKRERESNRKNAHAYWRRKHPILERKRTYGYQHDDKK